MSKFSVDQRVKQFDKDENQWVKGKIIRVEENSIIIDWDDLVSYCTHLEDEFDTIFVIE